MVRDGCEGTFVYYRAADAHVRNLLAEAPGHAEHTEGEAPTQTPAVSQPAGQARPSGSLALGAQADQVDAVLVDGETVLAGDGPGGTVCREPLPDTGEATGSFGVHVLPVHGLGASWAEFLEWGA